MHRPSPRGGNVLTTAVVLVLGLSAIVGGLFSMTRRECAERARWRDETRAYFAAEAGVNEVLWTLVQGGEPALEHLTYPREVGSGSVTVRIERRRDDPSLAPGHIRFLSTGVEGDVRADIEVLVKAERVGETLEFEQVAWNVLSGGPRQAGP